MADTDQSGRIADYLLGRMSEAERETFEQHYLADDRLFDEVLAVEDELWLDYARGALTPDDRAAMDARLVRGANGRERLMWARALAAWFDRQPLTAAPRPSGMSPKIVLPLAAVLVLGIGALLVQNVELRRTLDQARQQARAADERSGTIATQLQAERAERGSPPTVPAVIALTLTPGLVRGAATLPRVEIPASPAVLQLRLILPPDTAIRPFAADVLDADGRVVWSGDVTRTADGHLVVIPTPHLARGDYELVLRERQVPTGSIGIAEYYFSVR